MAVLGVRKGVQNGVLGGDRGVQPGNDKTTNFAGRAGSLDPLEKGGGGGGIISTEPQFWPFSGVFGGIPQNWPFPGFSGFWRFPGYLLAFLIRIAADLLRQHFTMLKLQSRSTSRTKT